VPPRSGATVAEARSPSIGMAIRVARRQIFPSQGGTFFRVGKIFPATAFIVNAPLTNNLDQVHAFNYLNSLIDLLARRLLQGAMVA
jgi:hypothetical protein